MGDPFDMNSRALVLINATTPTAPTSSRCVHTANPGPRRDDADDRPNQRPQAVGRMELGHDRPAKHCGKMNRRRVHRDVGCAVAGTENEQRQPQR